MIFRAKYAYSGLLLASLAVPACPALAGDAPLYESYPDWVVRADLPKDPEAARSPILIVDQQDRIESGKLWSYRDFAARFDTAQDLTQMGTVTAEWSPDKGDLVVHDIAIFRDGEWQDLVKSGARFEVLRREQQLEQRIVDGSLTASLAVPGLQVGDVLRVSYSVSRSDQALDQEVQSINFLPSRPNFRVEMGRTIVSWPEGSEVFWKAGPDVDLPEPETYDGHTWLTVDLPLDRRAEMPADAPARFHRPALLQVGTFASWEEVSSVFAHHFSTDGLIKEGGPIDTEIARIEANHSGQHQRALAALQLVQDRISYLLNGMSGGNYIPQAPEETWQLRYGDCKAKSLLLLSILRQMGISAEAVLVNSQLGDALPEQLPVPANFDHVIVRAEIDGQDYWLDGTGIGATARSLGDVPAFSFGLPLREEGTGLYPIVQRAPEFPLSVARLEIDERAGPDVPFTYSGEFRLEGPMVAQVLNLIEKLDETQTREFVQGYVSNFAGNNWPTEYEISPGEGDEAGSLTITASGIASPEWSFRGSDGNRHFTLASGQFGFSPDRARRSWRDIPVRLGGPAWGQLDLTVRLPEAKSPYSLSGLTDLDAEIAGIVIHRKAALDGQTVRVTDEIKWPGGELPADGISAAKTKAAAIQQGQLGLSAPRDILRGWHYAGDADRSRLRKLEDAYETLISFDPMAMAVYMARAAFRTTTLDFEGALEDLDVVLDEEPTPQLYLSRAEIHRKLGMDAMALRDAERAMELDPSPDRQLSLAFYLGNDGDIEGGLLVLEDLRGNADLERRLRMSQADLYALAGQLDHAVGLIDGELAEHPDDPELLNAKCWLSASWQFKVSDALADCIKAVELAAWSPPVLDSRAMAYLRLGQLDKALADINAALAVAPDQTPSLFLRGVIRREAGDKAGAESDFAQALARDPSLTRQYERYGFTF